MKLDIKTKFPLIIAVVFFVVVLIIIAIGLVPAKKETPSKEKRPAAEIAKELYGFSATIREIKDKTLILEASIPMTDLSKSEKRIVKGLVSEKTKIVKLGFGQLSESDQPVNPEEKEISFEELKVGDNIDVRTVVNISENIKNNTEFEINYILVSEK